MHNLYNYLTLNEGVSYCLISIQVCTTCTIIKDWIRVYLFCFCCQGKGVVSRGVEQTEPGECGGRGQRTLKEILGINNPWYMNSPAMAYFFLGCFITLSIFLYLSTCYYRKRFYLFKKTKRQPDKSKCKINDQQRTNERQHRKRNEVKLLLYRFPPTLTSTFGFYNVE